QLHFNKFVTCSYCEGGFKKSIICIINPPPAAVDKVLLQKVIVAHPLCIKIVVLQVDKTKIKYGVKRRRANSYTGLYKKALHPQVNITPHLSCSITHIAVCNHFIFIAFGIISSHAKLE